MAHYINVPVNENGILFDPNMKGVVTEAMAPEPFGFGDVFIYSHGWATNAVSMMDTYNRFSVELASSVMTFEAATRGTPKAYAQAPQTNLGVGIHWPSEITEDPSSPLNALQLLTFYTMEHRADVVGSNAVYALLRLILNARLGTGLPLRIFLLGHSFGCKVICSALQDMQVDVNNRTIVIPPETKFRAVLLEPATDFDNLESTDIYGNVYQIPDLRMLITKSQQDLALKTWYLEAGRVANLFNPKPALGSAGPSQDTVNLFGGSNGLSVGSGLTPPDMYEYRSRLIVADLTAIHAERAASKQWVNGGIGGQHSDIFFPEIYNMISGFIYT